MKKIPEIISPKDLLYLEDMFNWHFVLCKKAYSYSEYVIDEEIAKHIENIAKKHEKICTRILAILESGVK